MDELMEHQAGERQEVQARQHRGQTLVVTGAAAETTEPGETALNDPAAWQEHEAAFGLGEPDDLELDALCCCRCLRFGVGVAFVDVGQLSSTVSPVTACTAAASAATWV